MENKTENNENISLNNNLTPCKLYQNNNKDKDNCTPLSTTNKTGLNNFLFFLFFSFYSFYS